MSQDRGDTSSPRDRIHLLRDALPPSGGIVVLRPPGKRNRLNSLVSVVEVLVVGRRVDRKDRHASSVPVWTNAVGIDLVRPDADPSIREGARCVGVEEVGVVTPT